MPPLPRGDHQSVSKVCWMQRRLCNHDIAVHLRIELHVMLEATSMNHFIPVYFPLTSDSYSATLSYSEINVPMNKTQGEKLFLTKNIEHHSLGNNPLYRAAVIGS